MFQNTKSLLTILFLSVMTFPVQAQDCGDFRTQTQGGWGSGANGNNPGMYRDAHFEQAFPNGLIIGCDYTLTFTSAAAIEAFLPEGGPASILDESAVNPISIHNVMAGQLVALTLSVGFDNHDPGFSTSSTPLEDQLIASGDFQGYSVQEILILANEVIGGCNGSYTPSKINNVLSSINENYVDGTMNGGFLECPPEEPCAMEIVNCSDLPVEELSCEDSIPPSDPGIFEVVNSCGPVAVTIEEDQSGEGCPTDPLTISRVYTFTDDESSISCSQVFRMVDNMPPVITCPEPGMASCDGNSNPDEMAVATDNCDADVAISYTDGPIQDCDHFIRTWRAMDDCGNMAFCQQTITIQDNAPPIVHAPNDRTISCNYPTEPPFTGVATATDECGEVSLEYVDGPIEGDDCNYIFVRTWSATDACGNMAHDDQLIRVVDLQGPDIMNAPPNQTLQCGEVPELPIDVYAIDACSNDTIPVEITENISENQCLVFVQRIFTATDHCGNKRSITRTIQIGDTQGPQMTCPENAMLECGSDIPGPETLGEATAVDQCSGDEVTITFTDGPINYSLCPPRAQRVWTATDTCGNSTQCVQLIQFQDTDVPEIECPGDASINCNEDQTIDPIHTGSPVVGDACSNISFNYSDGEPMGNCPVNIVRTWSVTDACGNSTSCQQIISITDDVAPQIICPPDYTANCGLIDTPTHLSGVATVEGECLEVELTYADGPLSGECPRRYTRTWTAIDACGNTSTCDQMIFLEDNMLPVVNCPTDTVVICGSDTSPSLLGEATAVDYCSSVSVSYTDENKTNGCASYISRTWTATDACGNEKHCIQRIDLIPSGQISIQCPADIEIGCNGDTSIVATGMATAMMECANLSITYRDSIVEPGNISNECGPLRTQTQGGWGTTAHGGNPGTYRDAHFDDAFPNGLVVGCDYTLTLTSSSAVQAFLPTKGGQHILTKNFVDPTGFKSAFAGQLVALSLSVGFDAWDPNFGEADVMLGDMVIGTGPLQGMTVMNVLQEANALFGGCKSDFSIGLLHETLTSINENYVDGTTDNGFLSCDEDNQTPGCPTIYRIFTATACYGQTEFCTQVIRMVEQELMQHKSMESTIEFKYYPSPSDGFLFLESEEIATGDRIEVRDFSGKLMKVVFARDDFSTMVDIGDLENGLYLVFCYSGNEPLVARILKI